MVFAVELLTYTLLVVGVLAVPSRESRLARRVARREGRMSLPVQRIDMGVEAFATSNSSFSQNWAGAVYESFPAGSFKSVTGTFVVPKPKVPSGGSSRTTYSSSAWVGIDGDTFANSILQTGVDFTVRGSSVSYDAWYEWFPDVSHDFRGISIKAGDTIRTTVTASSTRAGTAVIENLTTGAKVTKSLTSTAALDQGNAEWILEDFSEDDSLVPFANFGTVTFTDASAGLLSGGSVGPGDASVLDIRQDKILTSTTVSSSSVTISYAG